MTALRAASHTVLWKNPRAPVTLGANPLLGWQRYEWWGGELRFKKVGFPGPLASLALQALEGAIAATRNVTIAQQVEDPETASPADLLMKWPRLRPVTMICPERPARPGMSGTPRWIMAWISTATSMVSSARRVSRDGALAAPPLTSGKGQGRW